VRSAAGEAVPPDYRPLVLGLFWPSTSLVFPWERGPDIAAADDAPDDLEVRVGWELVAERLDAADQDRLHELLSKPRLEGPEAAELSAFVARTLSPGDEDDPGLELHTASDVLETWAHAEKVLYPSTEAQADPQGPLVRSGEGDGQAPLGAPVAAGDFGKDWRVPLRALTVRVMKDRAGLVGHRGFGPLLGRLNADAPETRIHLIGHSYGARVLLNGLCHPKDTPAPRVRSMLLLQPAVNQWCFADQLPDGSGRGGSYRSAFERVDLPILTTYSPHDGPLRNIFHHVFFRPGDLGDVEIAADDDVAPSPLAALGGYGPAGVNVKRMPLKTAPTSPAEVPSRRYDLGGYEIFALNGRGLITDHGEVQIPATAWAFLNLLQTH